MSDVKLKPCPFCGRSRNLSIEDAGGIDRYVDGEPDGLVSTWHVYCGWCGATGPEVFPDQADAVFEWNNRVGSEDR